MEFPDLPRQKVKFFTTLIQNNVTNSTIFTIIICKPIPFLEVFFPIVTSSLCSMSHFFHNGLITTSSSLPSSFPTSAKLSGISRPSCQFGFLCLSWTASSTLEQYYRCTHFPSISAKPSSPPITNPALFQIAYFPAISISFHVKNIQIDVCCLTAAPWLAKTNPTYPVASLSWLKDW